MKPNVKKKKKKKKEQEANSENVKTDKELQKQLFPMLAIKNDQDAAKVGHLIGFNWRFFVL